MHGCLEQEGGRLTARTGVDAEALWLPREDQLRVMLGGHFVAMIKTPGAYVVVVDHEGQEQRHEDLDAQCAYTRAPSCPCSVALRP